MMLKRLKRSLWRLQAPWMMFVEVVSILKQILEVPGQVEGERRGPEVGTRDL